MITALVYTCVSIAYMARLAYLARGYSELTFQHDRMEVRRVLRGTSGLYLLISAALVALLGLSAWFVVVFAATGAAAVLSALGGIQYHHDTVECPECAPGAVFHVESIEDVAGYADAIYGDVVVEGRTNTMFAVTMDGLRRIEPVA